MNNLKVLIDGKTPKQYLSDADEFERRICRLANNYCYRSDNHEYLAVKVKLYNCRCDLDNIINKILTDEYGNVNNPSKYEQINASRKHMESEAENFFDTFVDDERFSFESIMEGHQYVNRDYYDQQVNKLRLWYSIGKNVGNLQSLFNGCNNIPEDLNMRIMLLNNYYKDELAISDKLELLGNKYEGFLGRSCGYLAIVSMDRLDEMLSSLSEHIEYLDETLSDEKSDNLDISYAVQELKSFIYNESDYMDALEWLVSYIEDIHKQINTEKYYSEAMEFYLRDRF